MKWTIRNFFDPATSVEEPEEIHQHQWQQRAITYAAPRRDGAGQTQDQDKYLKVLLGVTTILDQCVLCQELRLQELLGSDTTQLDELLDKAEQIGPQYVGRNGVTFVTQRFQSQSQAPAPLPIR